MADSTPGTTPVTDRRIPPRGVLPRGLQMWLMVGVLRFAVPGDLDLAGVPLVTAILGAALVLVAWVLLAQALAPVRRRWRG